VTLWSGANDSTDELVMSTFKLLDTQDSHLVSFKSVCWLISVINGGDAARHLRLLYWIHLVCPISHSRGEREEGAKPTDTEEGMEAESFFVTEEEESKSLKADLRKKLSLSDTVHSPRRNFWSSRKKGDGELYREYEKKFLPPMNQSSFIALWRTIYSFYAETQEEEVFTALARVGSLLLQTGNIGLQGATKEGAAAPATEEGPEEWVITFEQFLANVVNEPILVKFFEIKKNIYKDVLELKGS